MTVQNTLVKNVYKGNGSTTVFPYTFALNNDECIKVYITDASGATTETTNFTIGDSSITYPASGSPLEAGSRLTIKRELPLQQVLNLVNQGPFFAEDIEDTFDELVMMIQQMDEHLKRTLSINVSIDADSEFDTTIPLSPGKTIKISDDGTHFENTEDPAVIYPLCIAQQEEATAQANIAKDRAVAALASETAAKTSEDNAKGSETAANNSKLAAAQSEANASQSASVATIAAQAAASSASEADATLASVKSYDDTYKKYMSSTETFANTALSAKNAAATSASKASASASEASGYAATAASKATEATNKASVAATKATEAAASADRAEQFADTVQDIAQLEFPLSITNGGTGASIAADACDNLGALALSGGTMTGSIESTASELINAKGIKDNGTKSYQDITFYTEGKGRRIGILRTLINESGSNETQLIALDGNSSVSSKGILSVKALSGTNNEYTFTAGGKNIVCTINGKTADSAGNIVVDEYTHPDSGVTAGIYRQVTVNAQGHVIEGSNPTITVEQGGTGATDAATALTNLGVFNSSGHLVLPSGSEFWIA